MRFRLVPVPKSMTLNDLWVRFKVIASLNATKKAKIREMQLSNDFDAMYMAGWIIRPTYGIHALVHLLTYSLT